jgi:hypothetical protein
MRTERLTPVPVALHPHDVRPPLHLVVVKPTGEREPLSMLTVLAGENVSQAVQREHGEEAVVVYDPRKWLVFARDGKQLWQWVRRHQLRPSQWVWACDQWRLQGLDVSRYQPIVLPMATENYDVARALDVWKTRVGR